MIKISLLLFVILVNQSKSQVQHIYTKEQVLNFLNSINIPENLLTLFINTVSDVFEEAYAFNEISKNPPQPEFDNNYYKKINFQERIKSINTTNTNFYTVYQEIRKLIDDLGDLHVNIDMGLEPLNQIMFSEPISFEIKMVNDTPKMFGKIKSELGNLFQFFTDYEKVINVTTNNNNNTIKSINGEDPFKFVTNFGGNYNYLKSPQAYFKYKFMILNAIKPIIAFPFSNNDLNNFTVVYDNNENITTNYLFLSPLNLTSLQIKEKIEKEIKLFVSKRNNLRKNINMDFIKKNIYFNNNPFIKQLNNLNFNQNNEENNGFNYKNYISCFVDNNKKVNIYQISTFGTSVDEQYEKTIINCTLLFDKNAYPIIVINNFNVGGVILYAQLLLELISSTTTINIYGAIRKTNIIKDTTEVNNILSLFYDYETCNSLDYKSLLKNENEINYGNEVKDTLLGPLMINGRLFREESTNIKKKLKNKRNPTDILVYTDGFSYSASAIFLKYLQYYGGGITVGYFPNPLLENKYFDTGLSPSALFTHEILQLFNPKGYFELNKNTGVKIAFPGVQTFYNPNNLSHPLEYEITPIDEVVNIYSIENNYETFIKESFNILERYKTNCNSNNKKILLISKECDDIFNNSYTHGGYICGDDGKWTNTCVASYCDYGYLFDHTKNECIVDICSQSNHESEPQPKPETDNHIILIIILVLVFIILIIIIIVVCLIKRKNRSNNEIESVNKNNNLTEGLNIED